MPNNDAFRFSRTRERLRIALQGGSKSDIPLLLDPAHQPKTTQQYVKWLEQLLRWIRLSGGTGTSRHTSLRFLFLRLEQNPKWKESFVAGIRHILLKSDYVRLFSDTGVHSNYDFLREGISRLVKKFFPTSGNPVDMEVIVDRVFSQKDDSTWIGSLSPEAKNQIEQWIFEDATFTNAFREGLINNAMEASTFLCVRASALSIQKEMMVRAGRSRTHQIPLLRLRLHIEDFFSELLAGRSQEEISASYLKVLEEIENSKRYVEDVFSHLDQFGVSVRLVFSLENIGTILDRLEQLVQLSLRLKFPQESFKQWLFLEKLLRDSWNERQIMPLVKSNFHLLARKIVEKSGETGKDYITETRREYIAMFYGALGGGFITAFTGLAKYLGPSNAAPFIMGLYATLNFSFCFILMHHLHFKLATKQPGMTAAALAQRLKSSGSNAAELSEFVELVARISRSQFAAVAGNILAVVPTALAIDWLAQHFGGVHILEETYAANTLRSFHPIFTLTVFYAALTGGLLWMSGLISGWVENAFVYFEVTSALNAHPFLNNFFGERRLARLVASIKTNLAGWTSSLSLGALLAFVPIVGGFFGLPLDVRHVTLTTGAATYSFSAMGLASLTPALIAATATGIFLIGAMNFGVSFALALNVASRANNISWQKMQLVLHACAKEIVRRPMKFFLPPSAT